MDRGGSLPTPGHSLGVPRAAPGREAKLARAHEDARKPENHAFDMGERINTPIVGRGSLQAVTRGLLAVGLSWIGSACIEQPDASCALGLQLSPEIAVDPVPVRQPTQGRWPEIAFAGGQYLAVWEDHRLRRSVLYGGRITVEGTELDPLGFPILDEPAADLLSPHTGPAHDYAVASDGTDFLVVTALAGSGGGLGLRGVRVSAAGEVLDPDGFVIANARDSGVSRQGSPALAFDGEHYLVAWTEAAWDSSSADDGVYWARVHPDGTVVDPGGVFVHPLDYPSSVQVSFDGTHHLLSWRARREEPAFDGIVAARMAPDGAVVDEVPIAISPVGADIDGLAGMAARHDGANHVIVWARESPPDQDWSESSILVSRVSSEGVLLDPDPIVVAVEELGNGTSIRRLDLATAGHGRSLLAWSTHYGGEGGPTARRVRTAQIAADGSVVLTPDDAFPRGTVPAVAAHADGGVALWRDGSNLWRDFPLIVGTRLDAAGAPIDGSEVAPARPASRQSVRAVASDGEHAFVVWTDTRDRADRGETLYGARVVAADGTPLDLEPLRIVDGHVDEADVVYDGVNYVVTWIRHTGGEGDGDPFQIQRVGRAGELLDLEPFSPPLASPGVTLASASDGTHTLLVGESWELADVSLAALILDHQGGWSDIIPLQHDGFAHTPAISFDGDNYLVAWRTGTSLFAQGISRGGARLGEPVLLHRPIARAPAVAGGRGLHLVAWQRGLELRVTRVRSDGEVLDPEGRLIALGYHDGTCIGFFTQPDGSLCPSVAFDGENFVVAWRALADANDRSSSDLYAALVSPGGTISTPMVLSDAPDRGGPPFLVGGDGWILAAYNRYSPGLPYDTQRAHTRLLVADR
jgi:hypothetical protein